MTLVARPQGIHWDQYWGSTLKTCACLSIYACKYMNISWFCPCFLEQISESKSDVMGVKGATSVVTLGITLAAESDQIKKGTKKYRWIKPSAIVKSYFALENMVLITRFALGLWTLSFFWRLWFSFPNEDTTFSTLQNSATSFFRLTYALSLNLNSLFLWSD